MNICMLVTNPVAHDPRVRREAATLSKAGYHVVVIGVCGEGYSPEEWLDGYRIIRIFYPLGVVRWLLFKVSPTSYQAFRQWYRSRRVRRLIVDEPPSGQAAPGRLRRWRVRAFLATLIKLQADMLAIMRLTWTNVFLARAAIRQRAEVYHAHDLDTLLAGYLAKRWTGGKLIYDFHELYTEQFQEGVKTALWHRYYSALERFLIRRTDSRMTICDSLGNWIVRRYGVNEVATVMNVPRYQESRPTPSRGRQEKIVLYHGLYFRDRALEQLIESARYLEGGRIVLRGYGYLEEELRALVKTLQVEAKVSFAPPVPMSELVSAASEADIGVSPGVPVCINTTFTLPNKFFEYMMAGLAIAVSDLPELKRIVLRHNLGGVFHPEDPRDIARVLNELIRDDARLEVMKRNSLQAARTIYNWEAEEQKLLKVYESVRGSRARPQRTSQEA